MNTQCLVLSAILFSLSAVTASAATFEMMKTKVSMETCLNAASAKRNAAKTSVADDSSP